MKRPSPHYADIVPQMQRKFCILASVLILGVLAGVGITFGAEPRLPPLLRRDVEQIRSVLEENFRATTEENLPALMETISLSLPGRGQFQAESEKMFAETDVYLRVEGFEMIGYRPPYAVARVVQLTLPSDEEARGAGTAAQQVYRGSTALLPEWERAVYTQQFKKEGGKWRLHGILEQPAPLE